MREALLESVYRAFDKDPHAVTALRIAHPEGFVWTVADRVLTARTTAGALICSLALLGLAIDDLAAALVAHGCSVVYRNADVRHRSAAALISGSSARLTGNIDHLKMYDTVLWSILDSYAVELEGARASVDDSILQLYLDSASGEWLDLWGSYFGVRRLDSQADAAYRAWIVAETLRPRSNRYAIEKAVFDVTGKMVNVFEPWTDMFYLSESKLDAQHLYDGNRWSPHVFWLKVNGYQNTPLADVLPLVERLRPLGVHMLDPQWIPSTRGIDVALTNPPSSRTETRSMRAVHADRALLGDYRLDTPFILDYKVSVINVVTLGWVQLDWDRRHANAWAGSWDQRTWRDVTITDGPHFRITTEFV